LEAWQETFPLSMVSLPMKLQCKVCSINLGMSCLILDMFCN
jgi:hypothetical protein